MARRTQHLKGEREAEKPKKYRKVLANSHPSRIYARKLLLRNTKVFHQPHPPYRAIVLMWSLEAYMRSWKAMYSSELLISIDVFLSFSIRPSYTF